MVTSFMLRSLMTLCITAIGHTLPAITPVRRLDNFLELRFGWLNMAKNMVGTPYSDVQPSASQASRVATGSNVGAGTTMVAPEATHARLPMT